MHKRAGSIRVQWCHGAPGVVASLASLAPGDDEHERLLRAGGELTWRAGPLAKGANLCHGTAGNGYAFLALLERTGTSCGSSAPAPSPCTRSPRSTAHAQSSAAAATRLWSGDPGTALYLADCLAGGGTVPLPYGGLNVAAEVHQGLDRFGHESRGLAAVGEGVRPGPERLGARHACREDLGLDDAGVAVVDCAHDRDRAPVLAGVPDEELAPAARSAHDARRGRVGGGLRNGVAVGEPVEPDEERSGALEDQHGRSVEAPGRLPSGRRSGAR